MTGCVFKAHKFKPLYVFALFDTSGPCGTIFRSSYTQFCKITKCKLIKGNGVSGLKNKSLLKKLWMGNGLLLGFSLKDHWPVSSASFFWQLSRSENTVQNVKSWFHFLCLSFVCSGINIFSDHSIDRDKQGAWLEVENFCFFSPLAISPFPLPALAPPPVLSGSLHSILQLKNAWKLKC